MRPGVAPWGYFVVRTFPDFRSDVDRMLVALMFSGVAQRTVCVCVSCMDGTQSYKCVENCVCECVRVTRTYLCFSAEESFLVMCCIDDSRVGFAMACTF